MDQRSSGEFLKLSLWKFWLRDWKQFPLEPSWFIYYSQELFYFTQQWLCLNPCGIFYFIFFLRPWLAVPLTFLPSVFSAPPESSEWTLHWVAPRGLGSHSATAAHTPPSSPLRTTWSGWCLAEWLESPGENQPSFLNQLLKDVWFYFGIKKIY